ncbi:type II toxin-antitoxin system RelE/ParE family toxin [Hymenobacter convexus]|uniref:type II toxin-antitoxin system RelE/ParE family toxin n=1 Tax=Hymenobacter sp. CA1UV-4 TaxID=3063782 RepID=UPI0027143216|nr:type II toxin-antitoxin system RelE/ParE family toxin [Hymenobacter sp. CA1UV-4]MDO7854433.1 type II toxin-antitoxin system RelE/ParE family toxin [Hymenobacter sp. CA1UV-4]
MKASYKRHFIAAQRSHENQNFRLELSKLHKSDIRLILEQITKWSEGESPGKDYESYSSIRPGLARWRIGDYRIYTYHLGGNVYIMLHVYQKQGQALPKAVKKKIVDRAIIYEDYSRAKDLIKYAKAIQEATLL